MDLHTLIPFTVGPLLATGLILFAGVYSGHLGKRMRVPSVTGQIIAGVIIGPSALGLFDHSAVEALEPFTQFALGLMTMAIGRHLNFKRLRHLLNGLVLLVVCEAIIPPVVVFAAVVVFHGSWALALLLAAMSVATAPATIIAIVKETGSRGHFVKMLVGAVALNNMVCITLFAVAFAVVKFDLGAGTDATVAGILWAPARQLLSAMAIGLSAGGILYATTRHVVRPTFVTTASFGMLLLTVGVADALGVSSMLACMFLGAALGNLSPRRKDIGHGVFGHFEQAILALFFTVAGMELDFAYLLPVGVLALGVAGARAFGKVAAARLAMRLAGTAGALHKHLGFALVPQAGVAVGLILMVQQDPVFAPIAQTLLAVGLSVVTLNEIVGPIMTRAALHRSGDLGQDRARLIYFLRPENIVTGIAASAKDEAVSSLAKSLIETHNLDVDHDKFVESVLSPERQESACIGRGLAVFHGDLADSESIVGIMGLSREGLDFDTPDGVPVHCLVLLGTSRSNRDHHLEIVASLSRSVASDRAIQEELYHASSPDHAYEILYAEEIDHLEYYHPPEPLGAVTRPAVGQTSIPGPLRPAPAHGQHG